MSADRNLRQELTAQARAQAREVGKVAAQAARVAVLRHGLMGRLDGAAELVGTSTVMQWVLEWEQQREGEGDQ